MGIFSPKRVTTGAICLIIFALDIVCAQAASVREVTMEEMLSQCQLVFEGRVTAIEAKENEQKRIHTYITFAIQEVIKGSYPNEAITLSFLGGTVGEVTMTVSDMKLPQAGEHGIYFVESLERTQVHPLYGWSQGHFLAKTGTNGESMVMTKENKPVTETMLALPPGFSKAAQTKGKPPGTEVTSERFEAKVLTVDEFKQALRAKIRTGP